MLIVGGGIGGLSAAAALASQGVAAHILEAETDFSEAGAGIQIGPNGARILQAWGLGEALERRAARPAGIVIRDGLSGHVLARAPLGEKAAERYGAPYYVAERRVLHSLLLEKVRRSEGIAISTGARVTGWRHSSSGVTAIRADGSAAEGCALIGADGVHSRIRAGLTDTSPAYSGSNAWRAVAEDANQDGDDSVNLWLGPDAHLVHYRLSAKGPINAVAVVKDRPASPGWGAEADPNGLMRFFSGWSETARAFLRQFREWKVWPLMAMPPLTRWADGPVALLGDAAHPMTPFLASGAVMAIEDAAVLAQEMKVARADAPAAFDAYQRRRMPRVRRVQESSARMGAIYHMRGLMRIARNATLAALPPAALLARNDWLYGYRIED